MKSGILSLLLLIFGLQLSAQKLKLNGADNGLSIDNDIIQLGGTLKKTTTLSGGVGLHSFNFLNLGTFDLNTRTKVSISTLGDMNLSAANFALKGKLVLDGAVNLPGYKNPTNQELSVDAAGNLVLVPRPVPPVYNPTIYSAGSGLTLDGTSFVFGGTLSAATTLNGGLNSLNLSNLGNFGLFSSVQDFKSTASSNISTDGDLTITAKNNAVISPEKNLLIGGDITLDRYKNNAAENQFLTVDVDGKLKLAQVQALQSPANNIISVENGLSSDNNTISFGGSLKRATSLDGNFQSLRLNNLDTFFLGGRHVQFINGTRKTTISAFDSLSLRSFGNTLISGSQVDIDGIVKLTGYKNSATMDSILTVDTCGNLKLVSQKSLQTIAQNAFMNGGNSFGAAAVLGTRDRKNLSLKTNDLVRGTIDTFGVFNYFGNININNSKLKTQGDIDINKSQPYASAEYQKAASGINFTDAGENLARGTISFNGSGMNYTSHNNLNFFSAQSGVPLAASFPDLTITGEGLFIFGGRKAGLANKDVVEPSAAYHFRDYITSSGSIPKGILFPRVASTLERNRQTAPAEGLMFYNKGTNDLEIYKSDGWHRFETKKIVESQQSPPAGQAPAAPVIENLSSTNNSFVQALGDGSKKTFSITHNLNAQYVMVQFLDCGPEANCNLLQIIPQGARVELDGKNNALVTFDEAPSFNRYKIMFLRVQ